MLNTNTNVIPINIDTERDYAVIDKLLYEDCSYILPTGISHDIYTIIYYKKPNTWEERASENIEDLINPKALEIIKLIDTKYYQEFSQKIWSEKLCVTLWTVHSKDTIDIEAIGENFDVPKTENSITMQISYIENTTNQDLIECLDRMSK